MPNKKLKVSSNNILYEKNHIYSFYQYHKNELVEKQDCTEIHPKQLNYVFKTQTTVPRTGLMLVGLGGNNGSTVVAGVLANKKQLQWETKDGVKSADYLGSITQSAALKMGDSGADERFLPFHRVLPMLHPNDLVIGGWDISGCNLRDAVRRAKVLPIELQQQLSSDLAAVKPLPSLYYPDFIAANQSDRADNCLPGSKPSLAHLQALRADIRAFKAAHALQKVVVLWTANTERCCQVTASVHGSEDAFLRAVEQGHPEIAPSQMFAMAAVLEGCSFVNGSPQNSLVPAVCAAATRKGVFVVGDDFKSGQTKVKSVLADFLVSAGIRPESIVSYNHLGNNDGRNLSAAAQFSSKELSKANVVEDILNSNPLLFGDAKDGENTSRKRRRPDHCVVIKYVPFVGDSKRAMDEYVSSIFMGGTNTVVLHNTCEDSLLAAPIILDLVVFVELFDRLRFVYLGEGSSLEVNEDGENDYSTEGKEADHLTEVDRASLCKLLKSRPKLSAKVSDATRFARMDPVLSALSYLVKAPKVPEGTPVVNALFRQRSCLENILRACLGLQPESHMLLEHKCLPSPK